MKKQQDNWKKRFEKFTNKSGFSNYECTNWKIKMTAKEFMPYIQKELDKAREEERKELLEKIEKIYEEVFNSSDFNERQPEYELLIKIKKIIKETF